MQPVIILMCLVLALSGCEKVVDSDGIQTRDGIIYLPNSTTPFSGRVEDFFENGQMKIGATYKNGKLDGLARQWYENGQRHIEATFKNGKLDGLVRNWYGNGQLKSENTYRNSKWRPHR